MFRLNCFSLSRLDRAFIVTMEFLVEEIKLSFGRNFIKWSLTIKLINNNLNS